jgi:acetyl-CoA carboxylase carboxyltransferase component
MRELILKIADEGDFCEIQAEFARNILTGFVRLEGSTVGVVANQPTSSRAASTSTPAARPRASCASATPSPSRS